MSNNEIHFINSINPTKWEQLNSNTIKTPYQLSTVTSKEFSMRSNTSINVHGNKYAREFYGFIEKRRRQQQQQSIVYNLAEKTNARAICEHDLWFKEKKIRNSTLLPTFKHISFYHCLAVNTLRIYYMGLKNYCGEINWTNKLEFFFSFYECGMYLLLICMFRTANGLHIADIVRVSGLRHSSHITPSLI